MTKITDRLIQNMEVGQFFRKIKGASQKLVAAYPSARNHSSFSNYSNNFREYQMLGFAPRHTNLIRGECQKLLYRMMCLDIHFHFFPTTC